MVLTGTYRYTYRRDLQTGDTRFSFLPLEVIDGLDKYGNLLCIGKIPLYSKGMPLKLSGKLKQTCSGFYYFHAETSEAYVEHETLLKQYLISSFQGLNEKKVTDILSFTGPDIFSFAEDDHADEMLALNVKGVSHLAKSLIDHLRTTVVIRDIMNRIESFGGLYEHAFRLFSRHGNQALSAFLLSPYKEGEYAGMDIYLCDRTCKEQGIFYFDSRRAEGYLMDAMQQAVSMGDSCLTSEQMIRIAQRSSENSCYENSIPYSCFWSALLNMIKKKQIAAYKNEDSLWLYLPKLSDAEDTIAEHVKRLQRAAKNTEWKMELLPLIEYKLQVHYNKGQKKAFGLLKKTGIKILTGPPGSGKTMTIKGMINAYHEIYPDKKIALCASTGRAAQVMSRSTGMFSQTLHKLLDIRPFGNWDIQSKNENDPIDADFIICDEVSMNGVYIMSLLFRAVKSGAMLLLVGDEDQLQSIDPGNVLYDLIHSEQIEVYRLQEVMRQQTGHIYSNALCAKNGRCDFIQDHTFSIKNFESEEQLMEYLKTNYKKADVKDHAQKQIITLTRVGICGTTAINKMYEQKTQTESIVYGGYTFHPHDKIIMNHTNYRKGYFNGDIGYISEINDCSITVQIDSFTVKLDQEDFPDIEPAEAITAHKAQGSEFDYVFFVVSPQYWNMLTRRILYTTMTRARKKLFILTCENAISDSLVSKKERIRYSNLIAKLRDNG